MLSILRVTLLCLLALAIPAQGFAAATRLLCGPAHHGAASRHTGEAMPVQALERAHDHHHAEMHAAAGHASWHDAHAVSAEHPDPSAAAASTLLVTDPPEGRCMSCAACCTAVALPARMPLLTAPPLMRATPLTLAAASRPAFITGGPDRPPRPFLA